ncbi:MAG: 1-deoxy-D-xylulose-5-phosphate synthase [Flavobacteriaceae bacterium]|nr:1-deoxy-D-xylulose-5-phosphate synthase [Flavobacteriaceae bacterium]
MINSILHTINSPKDIKQLSEEKLRQLADELRQFIVDIVATKEGHLGASLGVVELTIALHYVFDTPNDLLIWDVGHQAYGHKILTGRKDIFHTNRQLGGISGFPKRSESPYDAFGTGHSSTSLSAILGMAVASQLKGDDVKQHIAVIGDASIASGMAFEALNHLGTTEANVLIILNDNGIGIDPSVGALKNHFLELSAKGGKSAFFDSLQIPYDGVVDGHQLPLLISKLEELKQQKGVRLLHISTVKGKGVRKAEENQTKYHSPGKFDKNTGEILTNSTANEPLKYQDVFGLTLLELARKNEKIVGITPAMPTGSSLKMMMEEFPNRSFDVGISEQHAVTFSAGMATQGMIPYCTIYSSFLQRAYDQIIHDVALQKLPVIFCIDRAGIVGQDGATHHGVFDIAYLRCIPNMVIATPIDEIEFRNMLYTAQTGIDFPFAIRYPRGRGKLTDINQKFEKISIGKGVCLAEGTKMAVLSVGTIGTKIQELQSEFPKKTAAHYHFPFVKPLDTEMLHHIFEKFEVIVTIEEGCIIGGFGSAINDFAFQNGYVGKEIKNMGIPDRFIEHGTTEELLEEIHLSKKHIFNELSYLI